MGQEPVDGGGRGHHQQNVIEIKVVFVAILTADIVNNNNLIIIIIETYSHSQVPILTIDSL